MQKATIFQEILLRDHAEAIILFDGVCNFCNSTINFLIDHDPKRKLRYMSLQSALAIALQEELGSKLDSVVCITADGIFVRSDAVLKIAQLLPYPYRLLTAGKLIPKRWRDNLYDAIAKRRYQWFGKSEFCRIPTAKERMLFIETSKEESC
ncbi:DCC1-like thiol-disulfide oxidoreductase family protein [Sphingobacterium oryzagri]|uniref:DCC1-like thiol-disulfide oxidoreductase family protein n=1 Tax=Sphingobacterium oryzagri TaxID=3025669 RepID=A0ABY7WH71_9SPHI|nr:DCC1-like thiol-disulfide oxidoreductase family protein [Sphingobacterium sp. KACC 22765]WDF67959.1 DCC1-like thiol-disulfide oxidoreductase family protein [Sphingobacterium sp. KACC 22765]